MNRRLLIVDHYAVPPHSPGFSRQYHHAQHLQSLGWDTTIAACAFNHKTHQFAHPVSAFGPAVSEDVDGTEFRWIYGYPYTDNSWKRYANMASFAVNAFVRGFRGPKPDVVLGANPDLLTAFAAWALAKRFRVPFVFEVQDLWPESLIQLGLSNPVLIWLLEWLERFLYRHADAIVTLTEGISTGVRAKLTDTTPVVLVPTGADPVAPISAEQREAGRRDRGWAGRFVAIWAGAHAEANNLDTIIAAARIANDRDQEAPVQWVFVGDGPEKPRLVQMAAGVPNIEFLPSIPSSEVPALLQLADVGVIVHRDVPAVRGSRPTKLAEYLAAGLPIVSNLQDEPARLIAEAGGGITVAAADPRALAEAVQELATAPETARHMGNTGQRFISETYSRAVQARLLADVLADLTQPRRS